MRKRHQKKHYWYKQCAHFYEERELRRIFAFVDHAAMWKKKWRSLELVCGNVRFAYSLETDSWFWQEKASIESHLIVCPTVEKCHHSLEGVPVTKLSEFLGRVPRDFFFSKPPTIKRALRERNGVVAYVREDGSGIFTGVLELELDVDNVYNKYEIVGFYYALAKKYRATIRSFKLVEPKVRAVNSDRRLFSEGGLYSVKWDGIMRTKYLADTKKETWCDLTLLLAGNRYCVEFFDHLSRGIVVDLYNDLVYPRERATHLVVLKEMFSDELFLKHSLYVQRFATRLHDLKYVLEELSIFGNDGIIVISDDSITKHKDRENDTVDLLAIDGTTLCDQSGRLFRSKDASKSIEPNKIYEVLIRANAVETVCKKRNDKLFPNPKKTVDIITGRKRKV